MTSKFTRHVFAVFAILSSAFLAGCEEPVEQVREASVRPVKLISIAAAANGQTRRYPATISAAQSSVLAFQVGGVLQEVPIDEAQEVKRGDVLARLDPQEFEINASSAQARFDSAESEYQRAERLVAQDAIATSVLEQRKAERDGAKANLDTAQKALRDSVLRAPFDGSVATVFASNFTNVQPGQDIVSLVGIDGLEATINMPASVIATVPRGSNDASFNVILDAAPANPIAASFKEISLEADAVSQTYSVAFSFAPPETINVLPGMNASVEIKSTGGGTTMSVAVPLGAISVEGDDHYVWVIDDQMKASKRAITVADSVGETVIVTDGLMAGETIAGAGASYLAEGMQVRAWDTP